MKPKPHGSGARRPNIGVTPDYLAPTSDAPHAKYDLKVAYCDAVLRAGGLPLVLAYAEDTSVVENYLDRISGLLVTGGAFDVPPALYNEVARDGLGAVKEARTRFELALIQGALGRNLPVLGICGGMQLLNVVLGGSLFQDIQREITTAKDHEQKHDRTQPAHPVDVKDGTHLAELIGRGQLMVNSTHHQSVSKVGQGMVVSAAAPDGVIEAIESQSHVFALGVQWHPELLVNTLPLHLGIYRGFVQKARESRR
jgi:putative glutamine amidotransferase